MVLTCVVSKLVFFFSDDAAKKASKFRDWLDCSSLELKPNSIAMEILSYLAYETVAQVKKDPDSPEATPPSTPGSSHSAKPLQQGNGSLDGRARQRKRKKVCVRLLQSYL
eukprot:superscaffoldBa00008557_g23442